MLDAKTFEIRDRATFIPVIAVKMVGLTEEDIYLLRRAGFGIRGSHPFVVLMRFHSDEAHYDPFAWPNRRTLTTAHQYITENFDSLQSGDVIDVQYILGETNDPKASERYFTP